MSQCDDQSKRFVVFQGIVFLLQHAPYTLSTERHILPIISVTVG